MDGNFLSSTSPTQLPRILIAENNFSTFESLVQTMRDGRLHCDFDFCTSRDHALRKLAGPPYQLIISGVHLAEMEDFFLLKQTRTLEAFVPMVVTAGASDQESARHALCKGAFDLITTPVDHEQTVTTIRLALWQNKLMDLIARKEKTLEQYRQHLAAFPGNRKMDEAFNRALLSVEKTVAAFEKTIQKVEESIKCFADLAKTVENQARARALAQLDTLPK